MMKKSIVCTAALLFGLSSAQVALADDDFHGVLTSRPAGTAGTWVIGGQSFRATHDTELDTDHGPLKVGACVQVDMDDGRVDSIESEPAYKCPKHPHDHKQAAPRASHPTHDFYGIIKSRPNGRAGTWVIGGHKVAVSNHVELDADHGPLKVGACVQVDMDDGRVDSIESEPAYKCPKHTHDHKQAAPRASHPTHDFYGIIKSRPNGRAGTWVIGGHKVAVSNHVELDADHGALKVGACVQVDMDDGRVDSIESEPAYKCNR